MHLGYQNNACNLMHTQDQLELQNCVNSRIIWLNAPRLALTKFEVSVFGWYLLRRPFGFRLRVI
jgi:hypothetical protein